MAFQAIVWSILLLMRRLEEYETNTDLWLEKETRSCMACLSGMQIYVRFGRLHNVVHSLPIICLKSILIFHRWNLEGMYRYLSRNCFQPRAQAVVLTLGFPARLYGEKIGVSSPSYRGWEILKDPISYVTSLGGYSSGRLGSRVEEMVGICQENHLLHVPARLARSRQWEWSTSFRFLEFLVLESGSDE